jgi:peptidoglycan biosynthesis protein MviN/MurJ (putative lipid II flippase)
MSLGAALFLFIVGLLGMYFMFGPLGIGIVLGGLLLLAIPVGLLWDIGESLHYRWRFRDKRRRERWLRKPGRSDRLFS